MTSEEKRKRVNKLKRIIIAFAESYDQIDGSYSEKDMEQILSYIAETRILSEIDHREELDKAREEVFTQAELTFLIKIISTDFRDLKDRGYMPWEYEYGLLNKLKEMLSKLKDNK